MELTVSGVCREQERWSAWVPGSQVAETALTGTSSGRVVVRRVCRGTERESFRMELHRNRRKLTSRIVLSSSRDYGEIRLCQRSNFMRSSTE